MQVIYSFCAARYQMTHGPLPGVGDLCSTRQRGNELTSSSDQSEYATFYDAVCDLSFFQRSATPPATVLRDTLSF